MRFSILPLVVLTLVLSSAPLWGGSVLFSDLGPSFTYGSGVALSIEGSGAGSLPTPVGLAMPFTVAGTGNEAVTQVDLAITYVLTPPTFTASIWTDLSGKPGTQVAGAFWSLSASAPFETCCSLVAVPVSGVTLVGGAQYLMVVQPVSYSDSSFTAWALNDQGVDGDVEQTADGITWGYLGTFSIGVFDVLGVSDVPEPASLFLSATGLAALLALRRRSAGR